MLISMPATKDTVQKDLGLNFKHRYTGKFLHVSRVKNLFYSSSVNICPRQLHTGKLHVGGKSALSDQLGSAALQIQVFLIVYAELRCNF